MKHDSTTLTPKQLDTLRVVGDAQEHYGSLVTNSAYPRSVVVRLVLLGLVESAGVVRVCDDTGSPYEPERWREGFKLTQAGRLLLRAMR